MLDNAFLIVYLTGLIVASGIRMVYGVKYRQDRRAIFRTEGVAMGLMASLWGVAMLVPFLPLVVGWLDFAIYDLPPLAGWVGTAVFAGALWLLWRSHAEMGRNWSVTLHIQENHELVTRGVFGYIRHPMYAAHLLWGVAQAFLIQNWIAGFASLVVLIPLCLLRIPREEAMMLDEFGDEYRRYMKRTGTVIPRLR